jgi:biopolymer transport protein ExbD
MAGSSSQGRDAIYGINVTPLVDVVLVLLIAVMVTASYTVSQALPMDLPSASSGESESSPMTISIDERGQLFFDAEQVSEQRLSQLITEQAQKGAKSALIAAAATTQHRSVVRVIDVLRSHGVKHFAINVSPSELKEEGL